MVVTISSSSHEQSDGWVQDIDLAEHGLDIEVSGIIESVSSLVGGGRGVEESICSSMVRDD